MTVSNKLKIFKDYFSGNDNGYGLLTQKGWKAYQEPLKDEVLMDHLEKDTHCVGIYPIRDTKVKLLCFDVDGHTEGDKAKIVNMANILYSMGITSRFWIVEDSGRGYHLWIFFSSWIPAPMIYDFGQIIQQKASVMCEQFPKQRKTERWGNLIKVPFGVSPKSKKRCNLLNYHFEPLPSLVQWDILKSCQKLDYYWIERIIERYEHLIEKHPDDHKFSKLNIILDAIYRQFYPFICLRKIWEEGVGEGIRNECLCRLASHLNWAGFRPKVVIRGLQEFNRSKNENPLEDDEVEAVVLSAFNGKYNFGCYDKLLSSFCDRKSCKLGQYKTGGKR